MQSLWRNSVIYFKGVIKHLTHLIASILYTQISVIHKDYTVTSNHKKRRWRCSADNVRVMLHHL